MRSAHRYPLPSGWQRSILNANLDPIVLLRRAGLPDDLVHQEEPKVPPLAWLRFMGAASEVDVDGLLPLRLIEALPDQVFSPPLFAALCSPDLRTATQRLQALKPLVAPLTLHLDEVDRGLVATFDWHAGAVAVPAWLLLYEVLLLVEIARMGTRERVVPLAVTLPTPPADPDAFEAHLGCRVEPAATLAVVFSAADADRPFASRHDGMWSVFEPELRRRLHELDADATFIDRTRSVLLEALPGGQTAIGDVARRLAVSGRTLQRRLRDEGTSFQDLVRDVRQQLADHYLQTTTLTVSEIAHLLGFDAPTSFSRAYQDWTGRSPSELRSGG